MPIPLEQLQSLEKVVAESVRAAQAEAVRNGNARRFFSSLKAAVDSLRKLSEGRDCDYDSPFMGEAYALWYHMRRVSQLYCAFEKFETAFRPLQWESREWRMLDVGAGTGAGAMALTRWVLDHMEPDFPGALDRAGITCLEPALPMLATGERITRIAAERIPPIVTTDWIMGGIGDSAVLEQDRFDMILFSTTFDYFDEAEFEDEQHRILDFINDHLRPGGAVLFLVPRRGYKDGVEGPKVRFVKDLLKLLGEDGFRKYGNRPGPDSYVGTQEIVLQLRCDLFEEARRIDPLIALDRARGDDLPPKEQPNYFEDTYSYGCWKPR